MNKTIDCKSVSFPEWARKVLFNTDSVLYYKTQPASIGEPRKICNTALSAYLVHLGDTLSDRVQNGKDERHCPNSSVV